MWRKLFTCLCIFTFGLATCRDRKPTNSSELVANSPQSKDNDLWLKFEDYDTGEIVKHNIGESGLGYVQLKEHIDKNRITSIESLLDSFKKDDDFKNFLARPVLLFESESEQSANVSPMRPRAILHHDRLILAVTQKSKSAVETLSIVEFNAKSRDFEFDEVKFDQHSPPQCYRST